MPIGLSHALTHNSHCIWSEAWKTISTVAILVCWQCIVFASCKYLQLQFNHSSSYRQILRDAKANRQRREAYTSHIDVDYLARSWQQTLLKWNWATAPAAAAVSWIGVEVKTWPRTNYILLFSPCWDVSKEITRVGVEVGRLQAMELLPAAVGQMKAKVVIVYGNLSYYFKEVLWLCLTRVQFHRLSGLSCRSNGLERSIVPAMVRS